ncbi:MULTISPECIES: hypothetical protein [Enterobacterales]|uniref:hypothetical protein n=1 Tax=Enterobacterales TaxID=91347 RepID=UPI002ED897E8
MSSIDSNFEFWHNNVADIPQRDENGWYDLETGLRYDPSHAYHQKKKVTRKKISPQTAVARSTAKSAGGKALTGTAKQVKWAEVIRAEKIKCMSEEAAALCCSPDGLLSSAKPWIENRDRSPQDFAQFAVAVKTMREEYEVASAKGDVEAVKKIATEHNALTASWGFK